MAEVSSSYLNLLDPEDPHQILTIDSFPYWSHHHHPHPLHLDHFDRLFSSESHLPQSDQHTLYSTRESTVQIRDLADDDVSDIDLIANAELFGRENQVNFVMDLFQQRVEQSQVMGDADLVCEDSGFGVIEGNCDVDIDDRLDLDLGLGLGFRVQRHCFDGDNNCVFMVEKCAGAEDVVDDDDDDDFFGGRRALRSEFGEARSTVSVVEPFSNCVRLVGFCSDSDEEENDVVLGIDLHSENDEYGLDHVREGEANDDDTSIPLCWDSLQLEDHREANEDFEWEEVDGRVDEREVLSMFVDAEDERTLSVLISPVIRSEEEVRVGGLESLEWEVLLDGNDLEVNPGLDNDADHYFGEHEDYIYTADAEYEMLFGQFAEHDIMGKPPASKSVVKNLPSVVLTKEDVENNNALCAVCKDGIGVGEQAKQLPCAHRYHGDCILPWLGIRNTCPVCRHELPTDDAEYEHRRAQRAGRGV